MDFHLLNLTATMKTTSHATCSGWTAVTTPVSKKKNKNIGAYIRQPPSCFGRWPSPQTVLQSCAVAVGPNEESAQNRFVPVPHSLCGAILVVADGREHNGHTAHGQNRSPSFRCCDDKPAPRKTPLGRGRFRCRFLRWRATTRPAQVNGTKSNTGCFVTSRETGMAFR